MAEGIRGVDNSDYHYDSNLSHDDNMSWEQRDLLDMNYSNVNEFLINPATGLPMIDGIGSVDVAGNVYGSDMTFDHDSHHVTHHDFSQSDHDWHSNSSIDHYSYHGSSGITLLSLNM